MESLNTNIHIVTPNADSPEYEQGHACVDESLSKPEDIAIADDFDTPVDIWGTIRVWMLPAYDEGIAFRRRGAHACKGYGIPDDCIRRTVYEVSYGTGKQIRHQFTRLGCRVLVPAQLADEEVIRRLAALFSEK